jgi:hypothetical protein
MAKEPEFRATSPSEGAHDAPITGSASFEAAPDISPRMQGAFRRLLGLPKANSTYEPPAPLSGTEQLFANNPSLLSRHDAEMQKLRREIAIEQKSSGKASVSNLPSDSASPMHARDRRLYVILTWAAIPAALVVGCFIAWGGGQLSWQWAIGGMSVGVLAMVVATIYALEKKPPLPRYPGPIIIATAVLTWGLIGWQTWMWVHTPVQGYTQAPPIAGFTQAQVDKKISDATEPLKAQLAEAFRKIGRLQETQKGIPSTSSTADTMLPSPHGPINWNLASQFLIVGGTGDGEVVYSIFLQGTSLSPTGFKEAYAISGLTGHKQQFLAGVPHKGIYPVDQVDIPKDAPVQLELSFKPPLPIRSFLDQWGSLRVVIEYSDGSTYQHDFDERYVTEKLKLMVPSAFGPQVTPKEGK